MENALSIPELEQLIKDSGMPAKVLEREMKIPTGAFGKALRNTQPLAPKWNQPLRDFVKLQQEKNNEAYTEITNTVSQAMIDDLEITKKELVIFSQKLVKAENDLVIFSHLVKFCQEYNCTPDDLMELYLTKKTSPVTIPDELSDLMDLVPRKKTEETIFERLRREAQERH